MQQASNRQVWYLMYTTCVKYRSEPALIIAMDSWFIKHSTSFVSQPGDEANASFCLGSSKGMTLHSRLYFHPWPWSKSWPIKFSCLTPWPHQKSGLDPWLSSINHAHRSPWEPLTVSELPPIPTLTTWPASKFRLDCLTSVWPQSWVGVQSPI